VLLISLQAAFAKVSFLKAGLSNATGGAFKAPPPHLDWAFPLAAALFFFFFFLLRIFGGKVGRRF